MTVVYFCAVLAMMATCQAGPFRPVGYYTFDGKNLRPLNVVQKRSDDDGFSFGGRNGWKLPFAKPGFLSALTDRDEDDRPTVSAHQLLPDYLTHQEFLKPQLQAAGFSGGRIIAGPFPVPLARLPKPPSRSSSVSPTPLPPVDAVTAITKIKPPQQVQSPSLPTFVYKATPPPPPPPSSYKPVQFPAVQVAPTKVVQAARPPPPSPAPQQSQQQSQPQQQQQPKLVYTLPATNPVHWHAAHQSGPERQTSTLGVASFSHPAALVSETAGGSTRVSYGGWTPIYSASYAHVQTQQDPTPIGRPVALQLDPSTDIREMRKPIVLESHVVPERQVLNQPEAQQSLDDGSDERVEQPSIDLVPRVIVPGFGPPDLTSSVPQKGASVAAPFVVVASAGAPSAADDKPSLDLTATSSSSLPVVTETRRTVRKRKAKQVAPSIRRYSDRAINRQAAIMTASSPSAAPPPSSSSLVHSLPALMSTRQGRGQGRYIGRVLPATVFDERPTGDSATPLGWRQMN